MKYDDPMRFSLEIEQYSRRWEYRLQPESNGGVLMSMQGFPTKAQARDAALKRAEQYRKRKKRKLP